MIHNGIEYGLMQAYAEGFELMHASPYKLDLGADRVPVDARQRRALVAARADGPRAGRGPRPVDAEGLRRRFGRRALDAATKRSNARVPLPVLTAALFTRFRSREDNPFAERLLAALRNQFGGHAVKKA